MKIHELIKNSKNWFLEAAKHIKVSIKLPYVISSLRNSKTTSLDLSQSLKMNETGRKISDGDDDKEAPPRKKICTNDLLLRDKKVKIRKVALLLAYLGDDYYGMQVNTRVRTIEGELLSALGKAELIEPEAVNEPHTINFQRTARTDKGVSAAKQVVSLRIAESYSVENVNKYLPEDIKVISIKKVTKGFNCKNDCTARTYSYTLPTFALAAELHKEYPEKYRINEETLQKVNEILLLYKGTHNFFNFTVRRHFTDPSVKRYIMDINAEKPFLQNEEEFITLKIKGQSFMFHQIRKMVGHTIAVLKGVVPENIQTGVWKNRKYSVPLAPGLGLVLEDLHFDRYDRRYGNDGIHETLNWRELDEEVNNFKDFIMSNILKKEIEQKLMFNWVMSLSSHSYDPQTTHDLENVEEINGKTLDE